MIWNIIDHRNRPYRWKCVNAIIEATENDNGVRDADQADACDGADLIVYDQRERIPLSEAIEWAHAQRCPVTLYLYDEGCGTTAAR